MARQRDKKRGDKTLHDLERSRVLRQPRRRALVVCEGGKTEPMYFHALRRDKGLTGVVICPPPGLGTHPSDVIEYAVQLRDAAKGEKDPFERVWCVFDRDQHQKIDEALARAGASQIEVAFSNPCFELWFLLHHRYTARPMNQHEAESELKKHVPDYDKAMDVYEALLPNQQDALRNARDLRQWHVGNGDKETENPSTRVDLLVLELNGLAETH